MCVYSIGQSIPLTSYWIGRCHQFLDTLWFILFEEQFYIVPPWSVGGLKVPKIPHTAHGQQNDQFLLCKTCCAKHSSVLGTVHSAFLLAAFVHLPLTPGYGEEGRCWALEEWAACSFRLWALTREKWEEMSKRFLKPSVICHCLNLALIYASVIVSNDTCCHFHKWDSKKPHLGTVIFRKKPFLVGDYLYFCLSELSPRGIQVLN